MRNDPQHAEAETPPAKAQPVRLQRSSYASALHRSLASAANVTNHKPNADGAQVARKAEEEEAQTLRRAEEEETQTLRRSEEEEPQALRRSEEDEAQTLRRAEEEEPQTLRRTEEEEAQTLRRSEEQTLSRKGEEEEAQTVRRSEEEEAQCAGRRSAPFAGRNPQAVGQKWPKAKWKPSKRSKRKQTTAKASP